MGPAAAESDARASATRSDKGQILVVVEPIQSGSVQSMVERTGEIEALSSVDLYSFHADRVASVAVDVGDSVTEGQLLMVLEKDEKELAERSAYTSFLEATAAVEQARISREEAEDQYEAAQTRANNSARDHERNLAMHRSQLLTDRELETSTVALQDDQAAERAVLFRSRRATVEEEQAKNRAEAARIRWEEAKLALRRTELRAPIDGVITHRSVEPGTLVSSSSRVLAMANTQNLVVNLQITQKDLLVVRQGQQVEIRAPEALPGQTFAGEIERLSPVVDPASGSFLVRVRLLENPDQLLRPGLFVDCRILTKLRSDTFLVPKRAVFFEQQKPCFFVVEDGSARKVQFVPGSGTETAYDVLQSDLPLRDGMEVIVIGKDRLQNGDLVEVQRPSSSS